MAVKKGSVQHDAQQIIVRAGGTVLVLGSFAGLLRVPVEVGAFIKGSALHAAHLEIANHAAAGGPILIQGETGSGKEEAARVAHRFGRNKRGPFVAANCSAITESLAESELFGVKKNAVSGVAESPGLFGEAHGGTLLLDEIHKLPRLIQSKLLPTLQDGSMRVVGGGERKVDVQLVCATNVNVRDAVAAGAFAEDLYMRIAAATVTLPPLRARPDELPYHIAFAAEETRVHADFVEASYLRPWPGSVRELHAATRSAAISARAAGKTAVRASDLPRWAGMPIGHPNHDLERSTAREQSARATVWEPGDVRWPRLRDRYLRDRDVDQAALEAEVPVSSAYRWLKKAGLLAK